MTYPSPKSEPTSENAQKDYRYHITEYQTSIYLGKHFDPQDVVVNLDIIDENPKNIINKLTVMCHKNIDGTECKREIILPSRSDVKSLESYLDDGYLHFTCNVHGDTIKHDQSDSKSSSIRPKQKHR